MQLARGRAPSLLARQAAWGGERGWDRRLNTAPRLPGRLDPKDMSPALAAAARGDAAASFSEYKKMQADRTLRLDRRFVYGGLAIASTALFFAIRLSQRARLHEEERTVLREEMYAKIEESERRRKRLLEALPELSQSSAGLKADKAAQLCALVDRHSQ
eukprot:scaffold202242_cov24-Tisochrysis_lutea.AAC.1